MSPDIDKPHLSKIIGELYDMDEDSLKSLSSEEIKKYLEPSLELDFQELCGLVRKKTKRRLPVNEKAFGIAYKFQLILLKLFVLAKITYLHNFSTRYPDGDIKPADYENKEVGIVKAAPLIEKKTSECIDDFEKSLDILEKIN